MSPRGGLREYGWSIAGCVENRLVLDKDEFALRAYRRQSFATSHATCDSMFALNSLHIGRFTVKHIYKGLFLAAVTLFLAMTIQTASAGQPGARSRHHRNHGHKGRAVTHHHTSHHATHRNR